MEVKKYIKSILFIIAIIQNNNNNNKDKLQFTYFLLFYFDIKNQSGSKMV